MARSIKVIDTDGNMRILNLDQIISIKGIQGDTLYVNPNMESDNSSKKERLSIIPLNLYFIKKHLPR